jgi:hypothetical protein
MKATAAALAARLSRSTGGLGLGWVVGVVSLRSLATLSPAEVVVGLATAAGWAGPASRPITKAVVTPSATARAPPAARRRMWA